MGQMQPRSEDGGSKTEKQATPAVDRAKVSSFENKLENNDALKYTGKPSPLSKPT